MFVCNRSKTLIVDFRRSDSSFEAYDLVSESSKPNEVVFQKNTRLTSLLDDCRTLKVINADTSPSLLSQTKGNGLKMISVNTNDFKLLFEDGVKFFDFLDDSEIIVFLPNFRVVVVDSKTWGIHQGKVQNLQTVRSDIEGLLKKHDCDPAQNLEYQEGYYKSYKKTFKQKDVDQTFSDLLWRIDVQSLGTVIYNLCMDMNKVKKDTTTKLFEYQSSPAEYYFEVYIKKLSSFFFIQLRMLNPRFKAKYINLDLVLLKVEDCTNLLSKRPHPGFSEVDNKAPASESKKVGVVMYSTSKVKKNHLSADNLSRLTYSNNPRIQIHRKRGKLSL